MCINNINNVCINEILMKIIIIIIIICVIMK